MIVGRPVLAGKPFDAVQEHKLSSEAPIVPEKIDAG
jgi:hypothetical protein